MRRGEDSKPSPSPRNKSVFGRIKIGRGKGNSEDGGTPRSAIGRGVSRKVWGEASKGAKARMKQRSSDPVKLNESKVASGEEPELKPGGSSIKERLESLRSGSQTWADESPSGSERSTGSGRGRRSVHWMASFDKRGGSIPEIGRIVSRSRSRPRGSMGGEWLEVATKVREREKEEERVRNFDYSEMVTMPEMSDQQQLEGLFQAASACSHDQDEAFSIMDAWKNLINIENTV